MSNNNAAPAKVLKLFATCLRQVPDPRSSRGCSQNFYPILAITLLALLANVATLKGIHRWATDQLPTLRKYFIFKKTPTYRTRINHRLQRNHAHQTELPDRNTFRRVLQKISLDDLQKAFACFINAVLSDRKIVAAVDGKCAKQMKDDNGDPILMLNVFAQKIKVHLLSLSVRGDKTNEPICLLKHLHELVELYPGLSLLTGDAAYANRNLIDAMNRLHIDYLFQIKSNMGEAFDAVKSTFEQVTVKDAADKNVTKKKGTSKFVIFGLTS